MSKWPLFLLPDLKRLLFLIGYGALSLRFIWQTRKSIVGDTCDVSVPRDSSVKITPKIPAKFASLNSSIAFGDLRLGGCLRGPPSQAPARAQSPARNTRIKRRKIRMDFVGYFDVPGSGVFTPEFTVRAQSTNTNKYKKIQIQIRCT